MNSRQVTWLMTNSVLAICVYLGMYAQIYAVAVCVAVFVWIMLAFYALALGTSRNYPRPVAFTFEVVYDVALTFAIWTAGWYLTAVAYFLSAVMLEVVVRRGENATGE